MKSSTIHVLLFLMPLMLSAQTRPIVKIELEAGNGWKSGNTSFFLPALYIPVSQHLDLGVNYNSMKINYGGYDGNNNTKYFGTVRYKFPSFFVKFNVSKDQRRVNPFIGYIFSMGKGSHEEEEIALGSGNLPDDGYRTSTHMTPAEQEVLVTALSKTKTAHGFQVGVDLRLFRNLCFFLKGTVFTFSGQKAFPWQYIGNTYSYNKQFYSMAGFMIKFYDVSNKKLIK